MKEIFVFGSNLAGIHGAGAALYARKYHGAIQGQGIGLQGSSYALPTKDHRIRTLRLSSIERHVAAFLTFTQLHPDLVFKVTRIGCGLAGYTDQEIAPLFSAAAHGGYPNVRLPVGWRQLILTGQADLISDEWEAEPVPSYPEALSNVKASIQSFKEFLAKPIE